MTHQAMGLFNEQRTGKTPTSIMTMQKRAVERLLIVCPASMVYKWKEEFETWTGKHAEVITSAKEYLESNATLGCTPFAYIVNYENLRDNGKRKGVCEHLLKKYKPDGLIVDEAHRCKSRTTANTKAIAKCSWKIPYRLYLTGTPAPNKPWDVWTLLHFIDKEKYSSYWQFIDTYFEQRPIFLGATVRHEPTTFRLGMEQKLQEELNEITCMRKRKDVMPWLPKLEHPTEIKLPCTPSQKKYIAELEEMFETEHVIVQNILERIIRIRQICAAPEILGLRGNSPKLDWLLQYMSDYPEKKLLVFTNSKKFIDVLDRKLDLCNIPHIAIHGSVAPSVRQDVVAMFQSGRCPVLLGQTQAIKEGLTLDMADVTIFLDTYPPASDYSQAKDRMIATKQENVKPQEIIHLMMKDTYDEQLYKLVEHNVSTTDVINDYITYIKERK